jgi:hypothetical protein
MIASSTMTLYTSICVSDTQMVSRSAFDNCVSCGKAHDPLPDLPFTGYMQAAHAIDLRRLKK